MARTKLRHFPGAGTIAKRHARGVALF